jgi:hypothetical protein
MDQPLLCAWGGFITSGGNGKIGELENWRTGELEIGELEIGD